MTATTTLRLRSRLGGRSSTRPWRNARLIAVAALVVAGFGTAAAADQSSAIPITCAAHEPTTGATVTGPISFVPASTSGEIVLPERPPAGKSGTGHRYAVFCGGVLSNIEWINNG